MLFYVTSFFLVFIARRIRLVLIVICLSITGYVSLLDTIVLNFIAGCLISHFYGTNRLMILKGIILCCWVLCIITFNLLPMNSHGVYWALCASTLFGTFLLMPAIKSKSASYFGDISYGLYLTQMITLPAMSSLFQGIESFTFLFLAACTSVLVACLFYELIEKKVT